jgi:hypothetical protein
MRRSASILLLLIAGCGRHTARIVELTPAGRIVSITAPEDAQAGRDGGCVSFGANVGAGFGNLLLVAGGLDQTLTPNDGGQIRIILLAIARGRALRLTEGALEMDGSFTVETTKWGAAYADVAQSSDGWISTEAAKMTMPVPVFSDYMTQLDFVSARFSAQPAIDANGLEVKQGVLSGYVTKDAMLSVLRTVDGVCRSPMPPMICQVAEDFVGDGKSLVDALPVFLSFVNGFDTKIENDQPYACDPSDVRGECNAVSACFFLDIAGVTVRGPDDFLDSRSP